MNGASNKEERPKDGLLLLAFQDLSGANEMTAQMVRISQLGLVCWAVIYLQVSLPGMLHVPHGAAVDLLQALLASLVLLLQLVQLHPQVLPLLTELVLQLLERRLRLGQLHLQTLLQQRDLQASRRNNERGATFTCQPGVKFKVATRNASVPSTYFRTGA